MGLRINVIERERESKLPVLTFPEIWNDGLKSDEWMETITTKNANKWSLKDTELKLKVPFLLLPPPKDGGYVFTPVCLFVCTLDYSKSYEQILMKFLEGWGVAQRTVA